jgi:protein O-GlcNAc transferase
MQSPAQSLLVQGRFGEALAAFEADLRHAPGDAGALFGRATALKHLGRHQEARAAFDTVLAQAPNAAGARNNRGDTLLALGLPTEALADFDRAIALQPSMAQAHLGRGIALQRLHRLEESLACFTRALALWPECADAFFFRALSLERLGRGTEALGDYDWTLALEPQSITTAGNRAALLLSLKRFGQAARGFRQLEQLAPGSAQALNSLAYAAAHACDWSQWETYRDGLIAGLRAGKRDIQPGALIAYSSDPALMLTAAKNIVAAIPRTGQPLWRGRPFAGQKIRLAYCSADFHAHATSRLMAGAWERHDRARFELIAFDFGPDDASPLRARVKNSFDRFHVVAGQSPAAVAQKIADEGVDIAVDLMGLTANAPTEIFARRPAPVQLNYLGYPGTTGADFMDYILADAVVAPLSQQEFYAEKILHLPDCYQPNDSNRPLPPAHLSLEMGRAEAGLPAHGFVFCCFNNSWKINPPLFDIWMRLLKSVPGSVLWLIEDNQEAAANLRRAAAARGMAEIRLVFAPRVASEAHLARHRLADLFLDTLPYNAHTTASDALWTGVPLITVLGEGFAGRVAASLLSAVGLPELIAENLDDYEKLALALARDPASLAGLKKKLEANRLIAPLFDTARFTRNLEAAYEKMRDAFLARG